jgi:hypothetical protein
MIKHIWKLMSLIVLGSILILQGCTVESGDGDIVVIDDNTAPATPRGVYSITGDEYVTIVWYPNQETDLSGYAIYRSRREFEDYDEIATVGPKVTSYVDRDVENGTTYYYAVAAFDRDGNESDLSPETVDDTPRPAGTNVRLEDYILEPDLSGFDLSRPDKGVQPFDARNIDVYFGVGVVDDELSVPFIYTADDNIGIQDLGYTDDIDDVDVSPSQGFTFAFAEAILGHTYTFLTLEGNYAKIRIVDIAVNRVGGDIRSAWVTFDWAYQLQIDNPELAPGRN